MSDSSQETTVEQLPVHAAFAAVFKDVGPIAKNARNVDSGYAARSIDDMYDELHAVFARHGVFCLPRVLPEHTRIEFPESRSGTRQTHVFVTVEYDFWAADGSGPLTIRMQSEGKDSSDKATNKAQQGAIKYGLIQALQIPLSPTVDPDTETVESVESVARSVSVHPATIAKEVVLAAADGDVTVAGLAWQSAIDTIGVDADTTDRVELAKIAAYATRLAAATDTPATDKGDNNDA